MKYTSHSGGLVLAARDTQREKIFALPQRGRRQETGSKRLPNAIFLSASLIDPGVLPPFPIFSTLLPALSLRRAILKKTNAADVNAQSLHSHLQVIRGR